jgi:hypothetical protein
MSREAEELGEALPPDHDDRFTDDELVLPFAGTRTRVCWQRSDDYELAAPSSCGIREDYLPSRAIVRCTTSTGPSPTACKVDIDHQSSDQPSHDDREHCRALAVSLST